MSKGLGSSLVSLSRFVMTSVSELFLVTALWAVLLSFLIVLMQFPLLYIVRIGLCMYLYYVLYITIQKHSGTLSQVSCLLVASPTGAISWSSCKQKTIAQSTSEAEYMALADAANKAVWYWGFLRELGYTIEDAVPLHSDNKGAVDLALNPVTGHQSKHIDIKQHVICEYIEDGQISLIHIPTEEMVADSFIKSLLHTLLLHFNPDMGLYAP